MVNAVCTPYRHEVWTDGYVKWLVLSVNAVEVSFETLNGEGPGMPLSCTREQWQRWSRSFGCRIGHLVFREQPEPEPAQVSA